VVEAPGPSRYGADIETAIHFCRREAIQNPRKHADAGATMTVRAAPGAGNTACGHMPMP